MAIETMYIIIAELCKKNSMKGGEEIRFKYPRGKKEEKK